MSSCYCYLIAFRLNRTTYTDKRKSGAGDNITEIFNDGEELTKEMISKYKCRVVIR